MILLLDCVTGDVKLIRRAPTHFNCPRAVPVQPTCAADAIPLAPFAHRPHFAVAHGEIDLRGVNRRMAPDAVVTSDRSSSTRSERDFATRQERSASGSDSVWRLPLVQGVVAVSRGFAAIPMAVSIGKFLGNRCKRVQRVLTSWGRTRWYPEA